MKLLRVRSSAIKAVGYDPDTKRMHIQFTNNSVVYTYCGVPQEVYDSFIQANSMGTFYKRRIEGRYNC